MLTVVVFALVTAASSEASAATKPSSADLEFGQSLNIPAQVSELPLPPTVPSNGVCTNATGCLSGYWGGVGSPGFYWDPHYVLLGINYAGAPETGPASIYTGPQVVLEKTDGTKFADGDAWKCITCGVALGPDIQPNDLVYPPPHALPGDKQILVGNGILDCTGPDGKLLALTDPGCTPAASHIDPIYWNGAPLGAPTASSPFGNGREWRLSPDGVHLAWDTLMNTSVGLSEDQFEGALTFDPAQQRYDLTHVYYLVQQPVWAVQNGNQLVFQQKAMIGELRGWSNDGQSILGIQSYESDSMDAWSTNLTTGGSTPLTVHAEYTDPMFMAPNGKWLLAEEVNGSGRMDFMSGMQGIAPVTDLLTTGVVSMMRNAENRRYFEPWLVSPAAGRAEQINAAVADPDWNAAADPVWLADSTAVVWTENYACGANPTIHQCAGSPEPGSRNSRLMIARLPVAPSPAIPPKPISDTAPSSWAIPYTGQTLPTPAYAIPTGTYTIRGQLGYATVVITDDSTGTRIQNIKATYHNYVQNGRNIINGTESVDAGTPGFLTWNDNLTTLGAQFGTKVTSPGGFTVNTTDEYTSNDFQATGTMTTTINGRTYRQPANGA